MKTLRVYFPKIAAHWNHAIQYTRARSHTSTFGVLRIHVKEAQTILP
ncbi:hypothetical protein [Parachlamydia sp.]